MQVPGQASPLFEVPGQKPQAQSTLSITYTKQHLSNKTAFGHTAAAHPRAHCQRDGDQHSLQNPRISQLIIARTHLRRSSPAVRCQTFRRRSLAIALKSFPYAFCSSFISPTSPRDACRDFGADVAASFSNATLATSITTPRDKTARVRALHDGVPVSSTGSLRERRAGRFRRVVVRLLWQLHAQDIPVRVADDPPAARWQGCACVGARSSLCLLCGGGWRACHAERLCEPQCSITAVQTCQHRQAATKQYNKLLSNRFGVVPAVLERFRCSYGCEPRYSQPQVNDRFRATYGASFSNSSAVAWKT